jgi:penicillin-binding protein 1B
MPRNQRRKAGRARRFIVRTALLAVVVGGVLLAGYVLYLDHLITTTFEGRRWSIPARVYAQPLELYPGLEFDADDLQLELKRLGYRSGRLDAPGTYVRKGDEVRAVLRAFPFSDGTRPVTEIDVRFQYHEIKSIEADKAPTALIRVEPPLIGSFFPSHGEDRLILTPEETPQLLSEGLKVVEDRNFDTHAGFDLRGIARAAFADLRAGDLQQGGSTLTQQLVKSYFLDNQRTLVRKLKELVMSVILEARFDKQDLLNAYVNEIYLGQDGERSVHGFGLGSQFYFNKPISELDPAEIALLITVIRGPSFYNPFRHPERALERRDLVLGLMREFGLITEAEHRTAIHQRLALTTAARQGGGYYPAFLDLVREQLGHDYDATDLASHGYRIFTTLEPRVQDAAERAATGTLDQIEAAHKLPHGELETAVLVSNTQTAELSAIVGGRKAGFQGFNRALNASRHVGSLLKPVVYLTALESGEYNLASILYDAPLLPSETDKTGWAPQNFDGKVYGPVPLVRGIGDSLNLATVRLGQAVGVGEIAARLADLAGIEAPPAFPSLLLGAVDLTPMQMLRIYGVFASGGFATPIKSVIAVQDENGATLNRYPLEVHQVASPAAIAQLNYALTLVMQRGTGHTSRYAARGVAGKTGTSDDYHDSWFAGFDASHLAVVWVGYDDNRPSTLTGSAGAMPVWDALMASLHPTAVPLTPPDGYQLQSIDYDTGALTKPGCGGPVTIPIPYNAPLPTLPGCGMTMGERIRQWFSD